MEQFQKEAEQMSIAMGEFQEASGFKDGSLIVVGCSSSEIMGNKIGSATNMEAAGAILPAILRWAKQNSLYIAVQCCEHLNRCLVVEESCAAKYGLEIVNTVPYSKCGGALGATAMELFENPVVVESLKNQAHGGVDIGNTFIGMHLRRVAVCVRTSVKTVGYASLNCVRTRPILVGGSRAKYNP